VNQANLSTCYRHEGIPAGKLLSPSRLGPLIFVMFGYFARKLLST